MDTDNEIAGLLDLEARINDLAETLTLRMALYARSGQDRAYDYCEQIRNDLKESWLGNVAQERDDLENPTGGPGWNDKHRLTGDQLIGKQGGW